MIDPLIMKILEQLPSTAAVVVVVLIFMRFVSQREQMWQELHKEHLIAREASRISIEHNTDAMIKNTEASVRLSEKITSLKSICPYGEERESEQHRKK